MILTTKSRYAVTAMLDLAIHYGKGPINLAEISSRHCTSQPYMELLLSKLRKHSLVGSVRGPGGGYKLARIPDEISVTDVMRAVDEKVDAMRCGGSRDCNSEGGCLTHDLWLGLSSRIDDYLNDISLADLLQQRNEHQVMQQQGDFPIARM